MMSPMIGVIRWNVHVSVTVTGCPIVRVPPKAGPERPLDAVDVLPLGINASHVVGLTRGSGVPPHASGYEAAYRAPTRAVLLIVTAARKTRPRSSAIITSNSSTGRMRTNSTKDCPR